MAKQKLLAHLRENVRLLQKHVEELISSPQLPLGQDRNKSFPSVAGVYRIFDPSKPNVTIRVGESENLRSRFGQHLRFIPSSLRFQLVQYRVCVNEEEALNHIRSKLAAQVLIFEGNKKERILLECFLIAVLNPVCANPLRV